MGNDHAGRRDETKRRSKRRVSNIAVKIISEISAVGQIKDLEDRLDAYRANRGVAPTG